MERLKKVIIACLIMLIGLLPVTACNRSNQDKSSRDQGTRTEVSREPLDIKRITYLVYCGGQPDVQMYIINYDLKVEKYSIRPEYDKAYDFFAGELPPEDLYEVTEFEISEQDWSSMVNVLTRVNFMELKEDMSTKDIVDDGSSYYIRVETTDAVNNSGGYVAGYDDDPENRRFAEAKDLINGIVWNAG